MKIIVSAGGTGGHLYPALALVEYIKTQNEDAEFLFVGTTDRLESYVVPQMGYNYEGLHVKGLVGNPIQKLKNALIFVKSLKQSKKNNKLVKFILYFHSFIDLLYTILFIIFFSIIQNKA